MAGKNLTEVQPISAQENENMIRTALTFFDAPEINLHDPEQVKQRIADYFENCIKRQQRPSNLGLYAALGMTRQDVSNVLTGKSRSKVSPDCIDTIKRAKLVLSAYRESLAMTGKLNPATAIFWGKNFDQMSDVQTHEIEVLRVGQTYSAELTPDEISKRIQADIPLDDPDDNTAEIIKP